MDLNHRLPAGSLQQIFGLRLRPHVPVDPTKAVAVRCHATHPGPLITPYPDGIPGAAQTFGLPDRDYRPLPMLTRQEFSRLPLPMQRAYKNAYDETYSGARTQRVYQKPMPLPNMTPQQFSRMPAQLQREYERAFEREFARYQARQAGQRGIQSMRRYTPEQPKYRPP